jgi:25S rRNA (uracil2634-N3)-methyltransferase
MAKAKTQQFQSPSRKSILKKPSFKSNPQRQKTISRPASKHKDTLLKLQAKSIQTTIPFTPYDRILLIGEGDFSFSASLVTHHGCADIWATSYDTEAECLAKYPGTASTHIQTILEAFDAENDLAKQRVKYNVDATKLNKNNPLKRLGPFSKIMFNFPHTGGLSTDINRQVRANQQLLSTFFHASISLLSPTTSHTHQHPYHDSNGETSPASVIVTLFDSEPYTLWNIRDLARSAGYTVWRSWRFVPEAFPGYHHTRTAGTIFGKDGGVSETAWKGETRSARCYEFGLVPYPGDEAYSKKRRKEDDSGSEDE